MFSKLKDLKLENSKLKDEVSAAQQSLVEKERLHTDALARITSGEKQLQIAESRTKGLEKETGTLTSQLKEARDVAETAQRRAREAEATLAEVCHVC